jgi:glucosamine-phosphate N-acetyltransferase
MENYTIRHLEKKDYYSNYFPLLAQLSVCDQSQISHTDFYNFVDTLSENHQIMVIENAETHQIIAAGTALFENKVIHNMGTVCHIEDIVTDESYRGKGLGKIIINKFIGMAKEKHCYKIILDCSVHVKDFYEKCGFVEKNIQMCRAP